MVVVASLALSASCASLTYGPPREGGVDAATDVAHELGVDLAPETSTDGETDTGTDLGHDTGPDVATCGTSSPVDLTADPMHCGRCGRQCVVARGTVRNPCVMGVCAPVCSEGYGDCDGETTNGCEAPLNTESHCGSCERACPPMDVCVPPPPPNMSGPLNCVRCGGMNNACCRTQPACEMGLRCNGMSCVR